MTPWEKSSSTDTPGAERRLGSQVAVTRIRDEDRHSHFYKIIYLFTLFTFYSPVQFETDLSVNMGLERTSSLFYCRNFSPSHRPRLFPILFPTFVACSLFSCGGFCTGLSLTT